jgi:hypothetical protein
MPKAKQTKKSGNGSKAKAKTKTKRTAASETPAANGTPATTGAAPKKPRRTKAQPAELDALRAKAAEAKEALTVATNEASALRLQGMGIEAAAKRTYLDALGPYREACRKAGVECEFGGARAANKTPAVRFLVEKVAGGIKVAIKDRPETEQVLTKKQLEESIGKAADAYVAKFIGDRSAVGNKSGGLANRFRAVLARS